MRRSAGQLTQEIQGRYPGFLQSNPRRVEELLRSLKPAPREAVEAKLVTAIAEAAHLRSRKQHLQQELTIAQARVSGLECAANREKHRADKAEAKLKSLGLLDAENSA